MQCKIYCNDAVVDTFDSLLSEIKIGRKPKDCTKHHQIINDVSYLYLESQAISSSHANLILDGKNIVVQDTSRNGCILEFSGEVYQLQQSSKTLENINGKHFTLVIKAKEVIYKIRFIYQQETQQDITQELDATLVNTAVIEPQQKQVEMTEYQKKQTGSKDKKPKKEKSTEKQSKPVEKKSKSVEKKLKSSKTQKPQKTENNSNSPSQNSIIDNMLLSDSQNISDSPDPKTPILSKSISFVEPESFSNDINIQTFKLENPQIIIPKPLEKENFSYNDLLSDIDLRATQTWSTSISEQQQTILETYSTFNVNLNPIKISFLFSNKLRSTARFLLSIICGIPILNGSFLELQRETLRADKLLKHAKNNLFEPEQSETAQIDPRMPAIIEEFFVNYSLTEVCRRNSRERILVSRKVVVSDIGVIGKPAATVEDVYQIFGFCVVLMQLNCEIKVVLDPQADKLAKDAEFKEFGTGKMNCKKFLVYGVSFAERIQACQEEGWHYLLPKEENENCAMLLGLIGEGLKIEKAGFIVSVFIGEDLTERFLK